MEYDSLIQPMTVADPIDSARKNLMVVTNFTGISEVFKSLFKIIPDNDKPPETITDYQNPDSDYGLLASGKKTREKINATAMEIAERVKSGADLTEDERSILVQYSGQGGLTENSQYEYYTPPHVASGCWDALLSMGFVNGNVLDPCTGHGVFEGTKPAKGIIVTGCDIDPKGAKIAQLLNPTDIIQAKPFERLVAETPDNSFDACVTNVPFGDARGASKHEDPAYKSEKLIHRYFVLRILDKIKPGALAVLIGPTDLVGAKGDGAWLRFRQAVSRKAEFLGAHKLPSKTFGKQGTDTVVDVLVFKKHPQELLDKVEDLSLETLQETKVYFDQFIEGKYWLGEGRQFIMGKYIPKIDGDRWSREAVDGDVDSAGLQAKLAARFSSRIDWDTLGYTEPTPKNYAEGDRRIVNGVEYDLQGGAWVRVSGIDDGEAVIDSDKYGAGTINELKARLESPKSSLELTSSQAWAIYKAYPDLMPALQKASIQFAMSQPKEELAEQLYRGSLIGGMITRYQDSFADDVADDIDRISLQEIVTDEISRYGHPKNNKGMVLTGESSKSFGVFCNAVDAKGQFCDLLNGTIEGSGHHMGFDSSNAQSVIEHLFIRENIHTIELEDFLRLYTGNKQITTLGDMADDDNIAITPDGTLMPVSRYCAGDIYPKLQAMADALNGESDPRIKARYMKQIDMIMFRRKTTPADDIQCGFQMKWYPRRFIVDFLRSNGYAKATYGEIRKVMVEDPQTGKMVERSQFVEDFDTTFGEFHLTPGSKLKEFNKQFEDYLNGGKITSNDSDRIATYQQRARDLEEQFNAWMQQNSEIDSVTEMFNRKFNGFLPYEYEESDLTLEGTSGKVKLHGYQAAAVRRFSEEGSGIVGLDVGLGKTKVALALYAYNKQMGRTKKTCIVVPKSVLSNWYQETRRFLANMDDVLFVAIDVVTDKQGNTVMEPYLDESGNPKKLSDGTVDMKAKLVDRNDKASVYESMWEVTTSNKSLVVMTYEKYGMISLKPENRQKYTDRMVERSFISDKTQKQIMKGDDTGTEVQGKSYAGVKQDERNEGKFSDQGTRKEGALPYFEDMGITDIIVDEFHSYKNSYSAGEETSGIAYISNPATSQRALDMTMKSHYLRETNNGRGVYGLSATPVNNSPLEIFNMLSYVCPMDEFEKLGVYTVDDFVRVFGDIQSVDKVMLSGEVKSKEGLVGFQNLDGLRNLFHRYVLLKTAKDVNLPLPPSEEHHVECEMTDTQKALYKALKDEAGQDQFTPGKRPMFSILRDMERVTTDLDLVHKTMTFVFAADDKIRVDNLVKDLPPTITIMRVPTVGDPNYDGDLETQRAVKTVIPLEIEEKDNGSTYTLVVPDAYEQQVTQRLTKFNIEASKVSHPLTPKYALLMENCKRDYEAKGKQLIFTEEKSQHEKVCRILTHNLPIDASLISIINADEASGDKLQQISDAYNSGKVKIIVANKKAEVGVNLQKGTTAIHHLTFPWTPSSIQQRNGRGLRQGNKASKIHIYYYEGKGSFDAYKLEMLNRKASWIGDLFTGTEVRASNGNAMSNDELLDLLADNPEEAKARRLAKLAEKAKKEKVRRDTALVNQLQVLSSNAAALAGVDDHYDKRKLKLQDSIPKLTTAIAKLQAAGKEMEEGSEERKAIAKSIVAKQGELKNAQDSLDTIETQRSRSKTQYQDKINAISLTLRARAAKGELPFPVHLIDKPAECVVTTKGQVVAVGDQYEITKNTYGEPAILQVTEVFPDRRGFKLEVIAGNFRLWDLVKAKDTEGEEDYTIFSVGAFMTDYSPLKVSYSAAELDLKKLLEKELQYSDLCNGTTSKDIFTDHYSKLKWGGYGYLLVRDKSGSLDIKRGSDIRSGEWTVVFPDTEDESFRSEVCRKYLADAREWTPTTSTLRSMMSTIFGSRFESIAATYGIVATEADVKEVCSRQWRNWTGSFTMEDWKNIRLYDYTTFAGRCSTDAKALGDNTTDIISFLSTAVAGYKELYDAKKAEIRAEEEKARVASEVAAVEALKNDPRYKEVPQNVQDTFARMGITVKVNPYDVVIEGKYGKSKTLAPFSTWFFTDTNAKSGALFRSKEVLKSRFGACYSSNIGGEYGSKSWWYLPSVNDLAKVYDLIS